MDFSQRITDFQNRLSDQADVAFFPVGSSDLQYLTGVPRDIPNFGAVMHPGAWLEGAWLSVSHDPILALPRMSAEFGGLEKIRVVLCQTLLFNINSFKLQVYASSNQNPFQRI